MMKFQKHVSYIQKQSNKFVINTCLMTFSVFFLLVIINYTEKETDYYNL